MFLSKSDITLEQRLSQYPSLKNRIELLINIIGRQYRGLSKS
jgi:hypothetical protein